MYVHWYIDQQIYREFNSRSMPRTNTHTHSHTKQTCHTLHAANLSTLCRRKINWRKYSCSEQPGQPATAGAFLMPLHAKLNNGAISSRARESIPPIQPCERSVGVIAGPTPVADPDPQCALAHFAANITWVCSTNLLETVRRSNSPANWCRVRQHTRTHREAHTRTHTRPRTTINSVRWIYLCRATRSRPWPQNCYGPVVGISERSERLIRACF